MNNGIQIRISDLIFALQKRWKMILAGTFVGLVFGLMLSAMTFMQSTLTSYQIAGSFVITTQSPNGLFVNGFTNAGNNDLMLAEDMAEAVLYVVRSHRVISEVITDHQLLGTTVAQMSSALTVTQYQDTQIIEMSLVWHNAEDGLKIWNAIVDKSNEIIPLTLQTGRLAVLDNPEVFALGVAGMGKSMPVILAVLGFIVSVGYAVMELLVRPTLNNVRDVETMFGLETIGLIPRDDKYFRQNKALLTEDDVGNSEIIQNYAAGAYILRNLLGNKEKHHCFFVTSAAAQEGKTTVAANLAVQLSDMECRTLLIDFNTRNPSLGSLFMDKVDYAHSLNALYRGEVSEDEAITPVTGYLDLLPMVLERGSVPMDAQVVEMIQNLTEKYDYVILDSAAVGMASDTLSIKQVADSVLYVIGYDKSTIPEIQRSLEKLDKSGIRVIGCIVNGVQTTRNWIDSNSNKEENKKRRKKGTPKKQKEVPADVNAEAPSEIEGMLTKKDKPAQEEEPAQEKEPENAPAPAAEKGGKRKGLFGFLQGREKKDRKTAASVPDETEEDIAEDENDASGRVQPPKSSVLQDLMYEETKSQSMSNREAMETLLKAAREKKSNEARRSNKPEEARGSESSAENDDRRLNRSRRANAYNRKGR